MPSRHTEVQTVRGDDEETTIVHILVRQKSCWHIQAAGLLGLCFSAAGLMG